MANVLFLGTGTQTFAVIPALKKNGNNIFIITQEYGNYADVSRHVSKVIYTDLTCDDPKYLLLVTSTIGSNQIDVIIPSGDATAEFVSRSSSILSKYAKFKAPEYESFLNGYDKNKLMSLCREKGYPHPLTIDLASVCIYDCFELENFPYPGFLKPNCTTGGRGMVIIEDYTHLKQVYPQIRGTYGECHLQKFIREGGKQVKIQIYINERGEMLGHSVLDKVRWYPVKGGSSCCSISIENEKMVQICHQILKDINWVGFADFDTIEDPDTHELLIMEINPRLPACIGASVCAGINWGQVIVDDALGLPVHSYSYKTGVSLRHLGFDVLWFLKSPRRWSANPSWFKFFGNTYYQDFHFWDQKPFWVGTYHNIKKLFDPEFRKAKGGK